MCAAMRRQGPPHHVVCRGGVVAAVRAISYRNILEGKLFRLLDFQRTVLRDLIEIIFAHGGAVHSVPSNDVLTNF